MNRRRALGIAVILAACVLSYLALRHHRPREFDVPSSNTATSDAAIDPGDPASTSGYARTVTHLDAGTPRAVPTTPLAPLTHTTRDPQRRDEMRRQIYAAWSGALRAHADPREDSLHAPMPERDGGGVDPDYIRQRIREDFLPLAQQCYDQLLTRRPSASGRTTVSFAIVGDEHVGGLVDEATIEPSDASFADPAFDQCVRGSMLSLAFSPPAHGGTVRVHYPFNFTHDDAAQ